MQLLARLSEKRAAVEKEFTKIPAPPKASKDVFQLCRGFERAFAQTLEVSRHKLVVCVILAYKAGTLLAGLPVTQAQPFDYHTLVLCCFVANETMTCMQTVGYSAMIREAFQGDKGLQGIVKKLPIERQFRLDNVKMVSA